MERGKRNARFRSAGVVVCALTVASALEAQQQAPPTFRTGVSLVTVDVSVLDSNGKPVPGLQAGDFEIKLNGKVRPVKVVTFVEAAAEQGQAAAAVLPKLLRPAEGAREGTQVSTNEGVIAAQKQRGEDRVFVLLVDDLSFAPLRGKSLFLAARTFIEKLPAMDVVGVVTTSGSAAVNPTTDRTKVRSVLNHVAGEATDAQVLSPAGAEIGGMTNQDADGSVGAYQALEISQGNIEMLKVAIANACFMGRRTEVDSAVLEVLIADNDCAGQVNKQVKVLSAQVKGGTERQLAAFKAVIEAMKNATGLRHLVVMSDGLAIGREASQLTSLARAAAAAGVQISVLMEERDLSMTDGGRRQGATGGDGAAPPITDIGAAQRRNEDNAMFLAGGKLMAEMVGGQFYRIVGDPAPFFERVRLASSAVYRLGVEPEPNTDLSRVGSVDAKVSRKGVFVHANRLGVAEAAAAVSAFTPTTDDKLKAAISHGQSHGAVPLRVATALRRSEKAATLDLNINAEVPDSVRGPLIAMFGLVKEGAELGAITTGRREIVVPPSGGPFVLSVSMPVSAGSYRLRLAVADATGALGALDVPVEAALGEMGPLVASDLMTAWVDAKGQPHLFALEDLPTGATGLQTILELYAPSGGAPGVLDAIKNDVQVEFSLTKVGENDAVEERSIVPQLSGGVLRATVEFPTADLTPGTYRLRARVEAGGKLAGAAIATVKKK